LNAILRMRHKRVVSCLWLHAYSLMRRQNAVFVAVLLCRRPFTGGYFPLKPRKTIAKNPLSTSLPVHNVIIE
ncbi:MAG: hypothetical protein ACRC8W_22165, partial [Plesiomonas shigelloides]